MQLFEGVRLALTQIRTQKLKSFFSLLGVIVGVMFLIVVVSVVEIVLLSSVARPLYTALN